MSIEHDSSGDDLVMMGTENDDNQLVSVGTSSIVNNISDFLSQQSSEKVLPSNNTSITDNTPRGLHSPIATPVTATHKRAAITAPHKRSNSVAESFKSDNVDPFEISVDNYQPDTDNHQPETVTADESIGRNAAALETRTAAGNLRATHVLSQSGNAESLGSLNGNASLNLNGNASFSCTEDSEYDIQYRSDDHLPAGRSSGRLINSIVTANSAGKPILPPPAPSSKGNLRSNSSPGSGPVSAAPSPSTSNRDRPTYKLPVSQQSGKATSRKPNNTGNTGTTGKVNTGKRGYGESSSSTVIVPQKGYNANSSASGCNPSATYDLNGATPQARYGVNGIPHAVNGVTAVNGIPNAGNGVNTGNAQFTTWSRQFPQNQQFANAYKGALFQQYAQAIMRNNMPNTSSINGMNGMQHSMDGMNMQQNGMVSMGMQPSMQQNMMINAMQPNMMTGNGNLQMKSPMNSMDMQMQAMQSTVHSMQNATLQNGMVGMQSTSMQKSNMGMQNSNTMGMQENMGNFSIQALMSSLEHMSTQEKFVYTHELMRRNQEELAEFEATGMTSPNAFGKLKHLRENATQIQMMLTKLNEIPVSSTSNNPPPPPPPPPEEGVPPPPDSSGGVLLPPRVVKITKQKSGTVKIPSQSQPPPIEEDEAMPDPFGDDDDLAVGFRMPDPFSIEFNRSSSEEYVISNMASPAVGSQKEAKGMMQRQSSRIHNPIAAAAASSSSPGTHMFIKQGSANSLNKTTSENKITSPGGTLRLIRTTPNMAPASLKHRAVSSSRSEHDMRKESILQLECGKEDPSVRIQKIVKIVIDVERSKVLDGNDAKGKTKDAKELKKTESEGTTEDLREVQKLELQILALKAIAVICKNHVENNLSSAPSDLIQDTLENKRYRLLDQQLRATIKKKLGKSKGKIKSDKKKQKPDKDDKPDKPGKPDKKCEDDKNDKTDKEDPDQEEDLSVQQLREKYLPGVSAAMITFAYSILRPNTKPCHLDTTAVMVLIYTTLAADGNAWASSIEPNASLEIFNAACQFFRIDHSKEMHAILEQFSKLIRYRGKSLECWVLAGVIKAISNFVFYLNSEKKKLCAKRNAVKHQKSAEKGADKAKDKLMEIKAKDELIKGLEETLRQFLENTMKFVCTRLETTMNRQKVTKGQAAGQPLSSTALDITPVSLCNIVTYLAKTITLFDQNRPGSQYVKLIAGKPNLSMERNCARPPNSHDFYDRLRGLLRYSLDCYGSSGNMMNVSNFDGLNKFALQVITHLGANFAKYCLFTSEQLISTLSTLASLGYAGAQTRWHGQNIQRILIQRDCQHECWSTVNIAQAFYCFTKLGLHFRYLKEVEDDNQKDEHQRGERDDMSICVSQFETWQTRQNRFAHGLRSGKAFASYTDRYKMGITSADQKMFVIYLGDIVMDRLMMASKQKAQKEQGLPVDLVEEVSSGPLIPLSDLTRFMWAGSFLQHELFQQNIHLVTERLYDEMKANTLTDEDLCVVVEAMSRMKTSDPTVQAFLEDICVYLHSRLEKSIRHGDPISKHDLCEMVLDLGLTNVSSRKLSELAAQILAEEVVRCEEVEEKSESIIPMAALNARSPSCSPGGSPIVLEPSVDAAISYNLKKSEILRTCSVSYVQLMCQLSRLIVAGTMENTPLELIIKGTLDLVCQRLKTAERKQSGEDMIEQIPKEQRNFWPKRHFLPRHLLEQGIQEEDVDFSVNDLRALIDACDTIGIGNQQQNPTDTRALENYQSLKRIYEQTFAREEAVLNFVVENSEKAKAVSNPNKGDKGNLNKGASKGDTRNAKKSLFSRGDVYGTKADSGGKTDSGKGKDGNSKGNGKGKDDSKDGKGKDGKDGWNNDSWNSNWSWQSNWNNDNKKDGWSWNSNTNKWDWSSNSDTNNWNAWNNWSTSNNNWGNSSNSSNNWNEGSSWNDWNNSDAKGKDGLKGDGKGKDGFKGDGKGKDNFKGDGKGKEGFKGDGKGKDGFKGDGKGKDGFKGDGKGKDGFKGDGKDGFKGKDGKDGYKGDGKDSYKGDGKDGKQASEGKKGAASEAKGESKNASEAKITVEGLTPKAINDYAQAWNDIKAEAEAERQKEAEQKEAAQRELQEEENKKRREAEEKIRLEEERVREEQRVAQEAELKRKRDEESQKEAELLRDMQRRRPNEEEREADPYNGLQAGERAVVNTHIDKPTEWDSSGFLFGLFPGDILNVTVIPEKDDQENLGWVVASIKKLSGEEEEGWVDAKLLDPL